MRLTFTLLFVALTVAAIWSLLSEEEAAGGARARPAAVVTAWEVQQGEFVDEVSALGSLRAWESVVITSNVSEIVSAVHFEDGDRVEAGTVLVSLRDDEEQAALREQEENLADASREVQRLQDLAARNQVAQTELDTARTREAVTRANIKAAEARLSDRHIQAPFTGQLGLRGVSPGALVSPGQQITTLDDKRRMRLDFTVPAKVLSFLSVGQSIEARTPAYQQSFEGEVSAIDSRVDPVTRSVTVRAVLPNEQDLLKPGMLMEVQLRGATRSVLLLPEESLQSRAADHFVWVLEGESAKRTSVEIGARRPGWVEVVSGLDIGDRVVRDGVGKLRGTEAGVRVLEG